MPLSTFCKTKQDVEKVIFNFSNVFAKITFRERLNPLSTNPTKWSNTLKQFASFCRRIV